MYFGVVAFIHTNQKLRDKLRIYMANSCVSYNTRGQYIYTECIIEMHNTSTNVWYH